MALLAMCDNRFLSQTVADLRKVMKLNRHQSLFKRGRIEDSLKEHSAIMQHLNNRNAEATRRAMQAHFRNGFGRCCIPQLNPALQLLSLLTRHTKTLPSIRALLPIVFCRCSVTIKAVM